MRAVDFIGRQRHPADRAGAARTDRQAPTVAADEGDQRRRIDRAGGAMARPPGPTRADAHPATVMEGREAPRRIVDPGPAPRGHIGPMAVAVGRPFGRHGRGIPDGAVVRRLLPRAVGRQILIAGHLRGHGADRRRRDPRRGLAGDDGARLGGGDRAGIAAARPIVERGGARIGERDLHRFTSQFNTLAARHGMGIGAVGRFDADLGFAIEGGDLDSIAIASGIDVDAVTAALRERDRAAWGIDQQAARHGVADMDVGRALMQRQIDRAVVETQDFKFALFVEAYLGRAHLDLGLGAGFGPQRVAAGHRIVERRRRPFVFQFGCGVIGRIVRIHRLRRTQRDRAFDQRKPADATGRVGCQSRRAVRQKEAKRTDNRQPAPHHTTSLRAGEIPRLQY